MNVPAIHPDALHPNITPSQATKIPPSRGPTCGRNGCITPAFSGVPNKGTKNWGKRGTTGEIEENFARRARRAHILSLYDRGMQRVLSVSSAPFLEPPPSAGGGAHRPLTPQRPPSPCLAYPSFPPPPSFPLVGCAN